jgi:hypothetical protein
MNNFISRPRPWTEANRAAKAALFIGFYEENRPPRKSVALPVFKLSFDAGNRFDESTNEQVA